MRENIFNPKQKENNMTYSLTTIEIQGQQESVYEVYADESREQTTAYALEEKNARLIAAAQELLEACKACLLRDDIADGELGEILGAAITKAEGEKP